MVGSLDGRLPASGGPWYQPGRLGLAGTRYMAPPQRHGNQMGRLVGWEWHLFEHYTFQKLRQIFRLKKPAKRPQLNHFSKL